MLTINFIGCGRLGRIIARLFVLQKAGTVLGITNTSLQSAQSAVDFIGQGTAVEVVEKLPEAMVYFIATRDDCVRDTCEQLVALKRLKRNTVIIHCSGALFVDVLNSAKNAGCLIANVHPIKSFANPETSVHAFAGTYCAFDGDEEALPYVKQLFEAIGGQIFKINQENKKLYHAAMVMANNYLVTLHYHATQNLMASGIDETIAKTLASNLMIDALNNLQSLDHASALTGPLQRGDLQTIENHLNALKNNPLTRHIYTSLGKGTLTLTNHPSSIKAKLNELLR
jgi:predicted short-subunit dehydrogenase-like oxidoreductase (DUF2520 family)